MSFEFSFCDQDNDIYDIYLFPLRKPENVYMNKRSQNILILTNRDELQAKDSNHDNNISHFCLLDKHMKSLISLRPTIAV